MKVLLIIAVCAGLIVSGTAQAGEIKINQRFSGVNVTTAIDLDDDGQTAAVGSFQVKGSPGRATLVSQGEFTPLAPGGEDCPAGALQGTVFYQSFVETFADLSMLFYETRSNVTCFDPLTGEVAGHQEGIFTGGTGRFVGATGSWAIEFEAFFVGPTVGALTGTLKGTAVVPD